MIKNILATLGVLFILVGCAAFNYRNYGIALESYEGTLLGPEPKDDRDFKACAPNEQNKNPCTVLFWDEFMAMKKELLELREKARQCRN